MNQLTQKQNEYKKIIDKLYSECKYLLLTYGIKFIANNLNLSISRTRELLVIFRYNREKEIKELLSEYPSYKYDYNYIIRHSKVNLSRTSYVYYSKKIYGVKPLSMKEIDFIQLEYDAKEMLKEYIFPIIILGRRGIKEYLGISDHLYKKLIVDTLKWTIDKEWRKVVRKYNFRKVYYKDVAEELGVYPNVVIKKIKKYDSRKYNNLKNSIKKQSIVSRVGNKNKKQSISLKELKSIFEEKLTNDKEIHISFFRENGILNVSKNLYTIKKRYGLNVEYTFNMSKMKYILKEK